MPRHPPPSGRTNATSTALTATLVALALVVLGAPTAVGMAASTAWNAQVREVPGLAVVRQTQPLTCGPALIATLATLAGRTTNEALVVTQASLQEGGISLAEFARLASLHGLRGTWYSVDARRLGTVPLPYVAHLTRPQGGHFVAVAARSGSTVVVLDPADGALVGPAAALLGGYTGRVYVLAGGDA